MTILAKDENAEMFGGGGGGSSSGGDSSTSPTKPIEPVKVESNATATVDKNGNATTTVTDKNIANAVQAEKDAANKKGVNTGEINAVINVTVPANSTPNTSIFPRLGSSKSLITRLTTWLL